MNANISNFLAQAVMRIFCSIHSECEGSVPHKNVGFYISVFTLDKVKTKKMC